MGTADMAAIERAFSRGDGVLAIGTDPSEWWVGHAAIIQAFDAQFARSGTRRVVSGELSTFVEGTVGWAADRRAVRLADGRKLTVRETFVFHKEDGEWKIVQMHASLAVPGTADIAE
jgi:ketosteroid isomerase-like protein